MNQSMSRSSSMHFLEHCYPPIVVELVVEEPSPELILILSGC